jgi:hypothetical protein
MTIDVRTTPRPIQNSTTFANSLRPTARLKFEFSENGLDPSNIALNFPESHGIFKLTGAMLKSKVELLLNDLAQLLSKFFFA